MRNLGILFILFSIFILGCTHSASPRRGIEAVETLESLRAKNQAGIPTLGRCLGLPRVDTYTNPEWVECVGVIDFDLAFPRGVAIHDGYAYVVDKGSTLFEPEQGVGKGAVYRYPLSSLEQPDARGITRETIADRLTNPSGIAIGPGPNNTTHAYVSTPTQVLRIAIEGDTRSAETSVVIDNIPTPGWHYLTALHIQDNSLFLAVPSATDHCEMGSHLGIEVQMPCAEFAANRPIETHTAVIRQYRFKHNGELQNDFRIVAKGLRDALAMTSNPHADELMAADNGWDQIDLRNTAYTYANTPADEINAVGISHEHSPEHFGWPYCFDNNAVTPLYTAHVTNCDPYRRPIALLPAHSAPLGMTYSRDHLWVNLHGYAATGHRTVAFEVNVMGHPLSPAIEMVDWDFRHRLGFAVGRPFGIARHDQRLFVTDDWNHAVLIITLKPRR